MDKKKKTKTKTKKEETGLIEFKNAEQVVEYLSKHGWKISKSSFYDPHRKKGHIKPDVGKRGYTQKNVLKFASNHLEMVGTLQHAKDESLGRQKTEAEIDRLREQTERERLKRLREQGELIDRRQVFMFIASIISGLMISAKGIITVEADESVNLILESKSPAAVYVELFNDALDRASNEVSKMDKINAIFGEVE